jgi:hypothetical protein
MVTVVRTLPPSSRFPTLGARLSTVNHSASRCQTEPATLGKKIVNPNSVPPTEAVSVQVREAAELVTCSLGLTANSSWSLAIRQGFGA